MDLADQRLMRLVELFRDRRYYLIVLPQGRAFVAKALCLGDYTKDCSAVGPTPIGAAEALAKHLGISDGAPAAPPM
jgi:hypothetical protein